MEAIIKDPKIYKLFIDGPPDKGTHALNKRQVKTWIRAQVTKQRRIAASRVMNAVRYVSYDEFLGEVRLFIGKNLRLFSGPRTVIAVGPNRKKSNFWLSVMTSSILWHNHSVYLPVVFKTAIDHSTMSHIIDIDDCGYTGNQTGNMIAHLTRKLRSYATNEPYRPGIRLDDKESLLLINLQTHMTQYHICRIFASKTSLGQWRSKLTMDDGKLSKIIRIYVGQVFEDLETQVGSDVYKVMAHRLSPWSDADGHPAKTGIYFDHKMADAVSTLMIPLMFGTVLPYTISPIWVYGNDVDKLSEQYYPAPEEDAPDVPDPEQPYNIGSLINGCVTHRDLSIEEILEYAEDHPRCPIAWYKYIDYDQAVINLPSRSLVAS